MSGTDDSIVIVGTGHGGAALAALLRQSGYTGSVVMVGAERHHPYHRPPLSKKFAGPEVYRMLRPAEFYPDNDIDLRRGVQVTAVDRVAGRIQLSDESTLSYRALVLATGSTPRALPVPGADAAGVQALRTLDDAMELGRALERGDRLAIIGGGYVGMEVAAVARSAGIAVTVIERERRVLARVASAELSRRLSDSHRERGTEIRTGADVAAVRTEAGRARGVELADGTVVAADTVLVGIGAVPSDELAHHAGLACDSGVLVDEWGRTTDPAIFAIGDVARRPIPGMNGLVRLESIPNVTEQARQITAALLGSDHPGHEVPWFWSDQFDLKLKIAGLVTPGCRVVAREGREPGSFALFHLSGSDTVVAVETANAPGDFVAGKKFVAEHRKVDPAALADSEVSLRDVAADSALGV
ncbi:NAD(P)/FAD-dependent oxidoreductase [Nocardia jinanensis]|uniref:Ferredoxin reductase n=1 Tax=Nocardia jinanensis TaxID=382504 RepID=A0A917VV69_9NOCA|nr:FAD-dependent oxidoreductase [Nocardia jinanensis]GGL17194.1 ferredoxin reductase [Nocardia jinanensis]